MDARSSYHTRPSNSSQGMRKHEICNIVILSSTITPDARWQTKTFNSISEACQNSLCSVIYCCSILGDGNTHLSHHVSHSLNYMHWITLTELYMHLLHWIYMHWITLTELHALNYTRWITRTELHSLNYTHWITLTELHALNYTHWIGMHWIP